jgi:hypothetical protein
MSFERDFLRHILVDADYLLFVCRWTRNERPEGGPLSGYRMTLCDAVTLT